MIKGPLSGIPFQREHNEAIAICTPLMHRVYSIIIHSGKLVFIDASGNMDRQECCVFLLLTRWWSSSWSISYYQ